MKGGHHTDSNLTLRAPDGTDYPLRAVTLLGRESDCHIILADDRISRYHAKLSVKSDDAVVVEDLHSTNGTYVNGQRVNTPRNLGIGDELRLHKLSFRLTAARPDGADATVMVPAQAKAPAKAKAQKKVGNKAKRPAAAVQPEPSPEPIIKLNEEIEDMSDPDATYLLKAGELEKMREIARKDIQVVRNSEITEGPCLVVLTAPIRGKVFPLQPTAPITNWIIGRGQEADIRFIDRAVSKQHARIRQQGSRWRIENLSDTNKVFVNGAPVDARELVSGDKIRLGRTELQFKIGHQNDGDLEAATPQGIPRIYWLTGGVVIAALLAIIVFLLLRGN